MITMIICLLATKTLRCNIPSLLSPKIRTKCEWFDVCMECILHYQFYRMGELFVNVFVPDFLAVTIEVKTLFLSGKNLSEIIFAFMDLFKNCVSIASKNSRIHFPLHSSSFSLFKYHWQTNWFRLNTIHIWCINNISNGVLAVVKSSYRGFVTWVFGAGYFLMHSKRGTAFNPTNDEGKRIILAWRWFFT